MIDLLYKIYCAIEALRCSIVYMMIVLINLVMKAVAAAANAALALLPEVALGKPDLSGGYIAAANYFFPIKEVATVICAIFVAWIGYKFLTFLFRWFLPI